MADDQNAQPTSPQPSQAFPLGEASSSLEVLKNRIEELAADAKETKDKINKDFEKLEGRTHTYTNWMMGLIIGIGVVFLVTAVGLVIDYANYNRNFYRKGDLDLQFADIQNNKNFLVCVQNLGYFSAKCLYK